MNPPNQQPHVHGADCSHGQKGRVSSEIPIVFWVFSCVSGTFFQSFFYKLPLMANFFQIFYMVKAMLWVQPTEFYFRRISSLTESVPSPYLKQLLGGFTLPFFLVNFLSICYVSNYQLPDLESPYTLEFLMRCAIISTIICYVGLFFSDPGFLNSKEDLVELRAVVEKRPEIANPMNLCHFCNIPKIARFLVYLYII